MLARVTVTPVARVEHTRRGRVDVEHVVVVKTGALARTHRFPDARRADAHALVDRLVAEGATLLEPKEPST